MRDTVLLLHGDRRPCPILHADQSAFEALDSPNAGITLFLPRPLVFQFWACQDGFEPTLHLCDFVRAHSVPGFYPEASLRRIAGQNPSPYLEFNDGIVRRINITGNETIEIDGEARVLASVDIDSGELQVTDHQYIVSQLAFPGFDFDEDGFPEEYDNCPETFNPEQLDSDGDSVGDACDLCPGFVNLENFDGDGDGFGDACDTCPFLFNGNQADSDGDGIGDACDNCVETQNNDQSDSDGDTHGDACDNCPQTPNNDQADTNMNGIGDACCVSPCSRPLELNESCEIAVDNECGFPCECKAGSECGVPEGQAIPICLQP